MVDTDESVVEDVSTDVEEKTELKRPSRYHCILLNDDFTTMDFVVSILMNVFGHDYQSAVNIMASIHNYGEGIAGTYSEEIAQEKKDQVSYWADAYNYPLQCVIREADDE